MTPGMYYCTFTLTGNGLTAYFRARWQDGLWRIRLQCPMAARPLQVYITALPHGQTPGLEQLAGVTDAHGQLVADLPAPQPRLDAVWLVDPSGRVLARSPGAPENLPRILRQGGRPNSEHQQAPGNPPPARPTPTPAQTGNAPAPLPGDQPTGQMPTPLTEKQAAPAAEKHPAEPPLIVTKTAEEVRAVWTDAPAAVVQEKSEKTAPAAEKHPADPPLIVAKTAEEVRAVWTDAPAAVVQEKSENPAPAAEKHPADPPLIVTKTAEEVRAVWTDAPAADVTESVEKSAPAADSMPLAAQAVPAASAQAQPTVTAPATTPVDTRVQDTLDQNVALSQLASGFPAYDQALAAAYAQGNAPYAALYSPSGRNMPTPVNSQPQAPQILPDMQQDPAPPLAQPTALQNPALPRPIIIDFSADPSSCLVMDTPDDQPKIPPLQLCQPQQTDCTDGVQTAADGAAVQAVSAAAGQPDTAATIQTEPPTADAAAALQPEPPMADMAAALQTATQKDGIVPAMPAEPARADNATPPAQKPNKLPAQWAQQVWQAVLDAAGQPALAADYPGPWLQAQGLDALLRPDAQPKDSI